MPTLYGAWGSNKEIIFNFPKITDVKYSGYSVSSNICKVSNTAGNLSSGWCYATTVISSKNESGTLTQRISSYRSTINEYGDVFLKNLNDSAIDIGIYLNKSYPYAQIVINPESCSIKTDTIPYVTYSLVYAVPTISNIAVNRKYSTEQVTVDFTVNAYDSYSIEVNGNTVSNTKILKESFFNIGANTINITCVNGDKTTTKSYVYTFAQTIPTVADFIVESANSYVDEAVELSFIGTNYTRFALFNNNKQVATGTGRTMTVPKSGLVIGTNKFHVVLYNDLTDSKHGSYTKSVTSSVVNKTLKTYTPTVSNVVLENNGNLIDNVSKLSWQSVHQNKANVYINDKLYTSITTATSINITKGSFVEGQNKVKVEVIKSGITGIESSELISYTNTTYTMTRIKPTISGLKVNGTNTDNAITVSWSSSNQSTFKLYQDGRLIGSGQGEKLITLAEGILAPTNSTLKVVATYDSGFDTISVEESIEFKGTQNTPIIYGLEPSNISMNIDEVIEVSFSTNEFCDRWELTACGKTIQGTSDRVVAFAKNSFSKGNNTIKLVTYYSPQHNSLEVRTAVKTVSFVGYGVPPRVVLDDKTVYTTATPLVSWTNNEEQVAFEFVVKQGEDIVESKSSISTDNSIKLGTLENHKTYTISIRVKNNYDLWSEYATKQFDTNFNEIPTPTIEVFPKEGNVLILIKSHQEDTFNGICLYRKTDGSEWVQITDQRVNSDDSILDSTALGKVYYKARVFDTLGGYADSEVKSVEVSVQNYHFSNVQDLTQEVQLDFVKPSYSVTTEVVTKKFAGNSKPRIFKGNTNYEQGSLIITLENKELLSFLNFIEQGEVFCYRDRRGKKMFCFAVVESYEPVNAFFMEVSIRIIEINFVETKIYSGSGWRKVVYLNGSYYLDGAIDLSGYVDSNDIRTREERN